MMRIGVCGLGAMGRRIAARLVAAGHPVSGWNRTAIDPAAVPGVAIRSTPAAVAAASELVITMLADPAALRAVVLGDDGIASSVHDGLVLVDVSTVGPAAVLEVAARLPPGTALIDAPVLGSLARVESGTLRILVGGDGPAIALAEPVLAVLGEVVHAGPPGSGAALKLVANAATGSLPVLLSDALGLARRLGVETAVALDALEATGLGGFVERVRGDVERGEHPPSFRLALARKDLDLVLEAAGEPPLTMVHAAAERLRSAEAAGLGNRGFTAVVGDR